MAASFNSTSVATSVAAINWPAIKVLRVISSYRRNWTNKGSNKGFYTFTSDRTPGSYIG